MINEKFERVCLVEINNRFKNKIKLKQVEWEEMIQDNSLIFNPIVSDILNYKFMLHLLTNKKLKKTSSDYSRIYEEVKLYTPSDREKADLKKILDDIGLGKNIDITSKTVHGDIGEYIMNIIFLQLFDKESVDLIVPKLIYKTATKMPVFGDDNLYFDLQNNILYLGESKFYESLEKGLNAAELSIKKHMSELHDFSFLKKNTNNFKYNNFNDFDQIMEKIDEENLFDENTEVSSIVFIMEEDTYKKSEIEEMLKKYPFFNGYIIILPILNKKDFLEFYTKKVCEFYE